MPPLVSILVPSCNAALWLSQTLESALAQTWAPTEVIVVDDGSGDDSLAIARSFERRGVQVISQPNAGASAARNRALQATRGDFLQFLDADDLLSPNKIAGQLDVLAERPHGTIGSCAWGRFHEDPQQARFIDQAVFRDFSPLDFLALAGETGAMMHPSAWLVPRTIAERAGPWNESLSLNDDGEYFCRVVLASTGVAFCAGDDVCSYYRSGVGGSLSQRRDERSRRSQFRSIQLITQRLLAAENSQRTREACAGYWRRFVHDFYPAPAALIAEAEAEVCRLGGRLGKPQMGAKTRLLARLIGWRAVFRLKHRLNG